MKKKQQRLQEHQTTKIKPKQQRSFPNNEDQTTTAKAPAAAAAAKAPVATVKASFSSLVYGFVDVLRFLLWALGLLKFRMFLRFYFFEVRATLNLSP